MSELASKTNDFDADSIAAQIEETAKALSFSNIAEPTQRDYTGRILDSFSDLGSSLGFEVCRSKKHGRMGFLYDMVWRVMDDNRTLLRLPMVLESELTPFARKVDRDFRKLVQARAEVRVWVSRSRDSEQHIAMCREQIRLFAGTEPGDKYVFVIQSWERTKLQVERFTVL